MAEEQPQDEQQAAPKRDLGKILLAAFVVINFAGLGGGAFLAYKGTIGAEVKKVTNEDARRELAAFEEKLRVDPVLFAMPVFSTNLDGTPRRLVRVDMTLEMMDAEGYEEVISLGPEPRDAIMRVLNSKTFADLESVQGKLHLKNEIVTQLNGFLKKGVVKNVYFSDFVVQ